MDEQFVSIGEAAKMLGMSIEGLRKWEREGRLIPVRTLTNHRRYRVADLQALMHEQAENPLQDARCILYARVFTKAQQEAGNLDRQLGRLTAFAAEQHWTVVAALTDVASGLEENRKGLHQLLELARDHQASLVAVESRDRLARFGLGYLEAYLHAFGVRVVAMESTAKDDAGELVEDLIAVATSFSSQIYGKRAGREMGVMVRQAVDSFAKQADQE